MRRPARMNRTCRIIAAASLQSSVVARYCAPCLLPRNPRTPRILSVGRRSKRRRHFLRRYFSTGHIHLNLRRRLATQYILRANIHRGVSSVAPFAPADLLARRRPWSLEEKGRAGGGSGYLFAGRGCGELMRELDGRFVGRGTYEIRFLGEEIG